MDSVPANVLNGNHHVSGEARPQHSTPQTTMFKPTHTTAQSTPRPVLTMKRTGGRPDAVRRGRSSSPLMEQPWFPATGSSLVPSRRPLIASDLGPEPLRIESDILSSPSHHNSSHTTKGHDPMTSNRSAKVSKGGPSRAWATLKRRSSPPSSRGSPMDGVDMTRHQDIRNGSSPEPAPKRLRSDDNRSIPSSLFHPPMDGANELSNPGVRSQIPNTENKETPKSLLGGSRSSDLRSSKIPLDSGLSSDEDSEILFESASEVDSDMEDYDEAMDGFDNTSPDAGQLSERDSSVESDSDDMDIPADLSAHRFAMAVQATVASPQVSRIRSMIHGTEQKLPGGKEVVTSTRKSLPESSPASIPKGIEMATPDRPYNMARENGILVSAMGLAIPEGYTPSKFSGHPWVCPIRTCRRVFKTLKSAGGHFARLHRGCLLNDNGDGTFSITGNVQHKRAIVVSQHVRTDEELGPLAKEQPSGWSVEGRVLGVSGPQHQVKPGKVASLPTELAPEDSVAEPVGTVAPTQDLAVPLTADAEAMWNYIGPFLKRTDPNKPPPYRGYIRQFLELPRVRDISWNTDWVTKNPYLDSHPRDVSSLIMQVTGEYAPQACNKCQEGNKGPYNSCVVSSRNMSSEVQSKVVSCANCWYHSGQTYCSHQDYMKARFTEVFPSLDRDEVIKSTMKRPVQHGNNSRPKARKPRAISFGKTTPSWTHRVEKVAIRKDRENGQRRSGRVLLSRATSSAQSEPQSPSVMNENGVLKFRVPSYSSRLRGSQEQPRDTTDLSQPRQKDEVEPPSAAEVVPVERKQVPAPSTSIISVGQIQEMGDSMLEMEEWEVAPGRIRHTNGDTSENIAFSNSYLTSSEMVRVSPDISFRVETIRPGATLRFDADADKTRICSVAAGKLKVRCDEAEFVLGPNGMFKIKPGSTCSVVNRLYLNACLHISAVNSYS